MTDKSTVIKWVWLTTLENIDSDTIAQLLDAFDGIDEIFNAPEDALCAAGCLNKEQIGQICAHKLDYANYVVEKTYDCGAYILTYDDAEFPDSLRECPQRPYVLYVKGERLLWDRLFCIGIVGTRDSSAYGEKITGSIAYDLAQSGVTVVSGLARGIDSGAHRAAISAGGKTVAFLGCGIDVVYPPENGALYAEVEHNGAIFTEFPVGTPPNGSNFPKRNRLIAAFSKGILVTEAPKKSGALITASWALDIGKDVFAVPGDYSRENSQGCNDLIKASCAKLTCTAMDILEEYPNELSHILRENDKPSCGKTKGAQRKVKAEKHISIDDEKYASLDDDSKLIISALIVRNMHFDEICVQTKIDASKVTSILTLLEIGGYVDKLPGNNFSLRI